MRQTRVFMNRAPGWWAGAALLVAFVVSGFLAGCSRAPRSYVLRTDFSINVGEPAPEWPKDVTKLTNAEQDVLRTKGRPDMVHVRWVGSAELIDKSTMFRLRRQMPANDLKKTKLSWIYLSGNEEVVFADPAHWRVQPLSDKLRTVCEVGDPQEIRYQPGSGGERIEEWFYYNLGHIYRFVGERLVTTDKSSIPPMPNYLTR